MMISCELKLELHRGKIYRLLDFQSTVAQQASNGRKIDDEQTHRVRTCRKRRKSACSGSGKHNLGVMSVMRPILKLYPLEVTTADSLSSTERDVENGSCLDQDQIPEVQGVLRSRYGRLLKQTKRL
ncbi:hypothetical protein TNCT_470551 [Trichonephila clavata]|uniref:Uncharacterized protein n=1 Tax=Trichonephila clavata TaxID=2740835 RepID=A0A8X6EXQ2_TRICU|nr:hypothetical protein TNCT_470551 [Trichonephila clavata]